MATLVTEQGIVHYEVYGRGRPVLLLHGWLGSWALWRRTIETLGKEYRMYALDFWGFGESDVRGMDFSVNNFVTLVNQFMERLGIARAPLVGHSMGGTVSLSAAIRNPERVTRVTVIGSPITGASLNLLLKLSGYRSVARFFYLSPFLLRTFIRGYAFLLAKDGNRLGKMLTSDMSKLTMNPFFQSIGTLRDTDLRPRLSEVHVPVLGIYGKRDPIVNPDQSKVLKQLLPESQIGWFEDSGHFPMLDEPERFHEMIRAFLSSG